RLPQLDLAARLTAELDDAPHLCHLGEELLVSLASLGPRREEDRLGRTVDRCDEVAPEILGEERHDHRDDLQGAGERSPERAERSLVVAVEPPPRTTDVPVREVV